MNNEEFAELERLRMSRTDGIDNAKEIMEIILGRVDPDEGVRSRLGLIFVRDALQGFINYLVKEADWGGDDSPVLSNVQRAALQVGVDALDWVLGEEDEEGGFVDMAMAVMAMMAQGPLKHGMDFSHIRRQVERAIAEGRLPQSGTTRDWARAQDPKRRRRRQ